MRTLGVHAVRVHAQHARRWEPVVQFLLDLLRARRFGKQAFPAAHRALARDLDRRAAVVAHRPAGHRVIGHGRRARGALGHPAAQRAADHPAVAAPVEKQNGLPAACERVDQLAFQLRADHALTPFAGEAAHIRNHHIGQAGAEKALGQPEHRVFALFRAVIRLDRRGRRAEHKQRVLLADNVFGHVARMVARRLLGAVGAVLLLVDDEHAEVFHRREHRRARANHDARAAGFDLFEAVIPLAHRKRRVHDRDLVPELGGELPQHLGCQPDLRHEHDRAFAHRKRLFDQLEVDLGLAAAGHAEQQRGARPIFVHERGNAVKHLLLRRGEHRGRGLGHLGKVRCAQPLLIMLAQNAFFDHVAQRGVADAGHINQLFLAHPAAVPQHRDNVHPGGAAAADARHGLIRLHVQREHFFGFIV